MVSSRASATVVAAVVAIAIAGGAVASASRGVTAGCPTAVAGARDLGRFAFNRQSQLDILDLAACSVRVLVSRGVEPPVRWSADGRYIGFGDGGIVAADGGPVAHPLGCLARGWGTGSPGWVWSPTGHRLAGATKKGGLVVGGPGASPRRLLPDGWGATSIAFSPGGKTIAVSRSRYRYPSSPGPWHQEIWLIDLASGTKREIFRLPRRQLGPPYLYGFSPDGRWLIFWEDVQNSASIAADGLPLEALPARGGKPVPVGKGTLVYGDFLSWCNGALAYVLDRGGREVTLGDRIAMAGPPPNWPSVEASPVPPHSALSFNSPACSPPGTFELAAAAGPNTQDEPFGREQRRIWLVGYTGGNWHQLGPAPPKGSSDELPMWSKDSRWIAFVRTTWSAKKGGAGFGRLYLLELGKQSNRQVRLLGPIADVGASGNYYGHYGWGGQIAWYRR